MYRLIAEKDNKKIDLRDTGLKIIYTACGFSENEEKRICNALYNSDIGQSLAGNLTHCKRVLIKYFGFDEKEIKDFRTENERALDLKKCTISEKLPPGVVE